MILMMIFGRLCRKSAREEVPQLQAGATLQGSFNSAGKKGRKRTEVGAPEDQVAPITASQKRPPEEELRKVGTAQQ